MESGASKAVAAITKGGASLFKAAGAVLLVYIFGMAIYAFFHFSSMKSKLQTYGLTDATSTLLAYFVMFIALALPALALLRFFFGSPKPMDWVAVMALPLINWGVAQIPANFDSTTGEALKYCATRPNGELFCLDRPGKDPLTQKVLVKMDSALAERDYRTREKLAPKRIETAVGKIVFFDPLSDGMRPEPKVWVVPDGKGCYVLFDNPGVDPTTGDALIPVTKTIVREIMKCAPPPVATPTPSAPVAKAPAGSGSPAPAASSRPGNTEGKMNWKETMGDGSLPVGVWSETFKIPIGCTVLYDSGNGLHYKVRTRFSHENKWKEHTPGEINAGEEIQFNVLEAGRGMKTVPISIKC